jgi:hypothetical protein
MFSMRVQFGLLRRMKERKFHIIQYPCGCKILFENVNRKAAIRPISHTPCDKHHEELGDELIE